MSHKTSGQACKVTTGFGAYNSDWTIAFYADIKTDGSISDGNARKLITKIKEDISEHGITT